MASIKNLHLQYRLWIAEMNADINVLRIFDDYLAELSMRNGNKKIKDHIEKFKPKFIAVRKEMDDLRHEMHLNKMRLGVIAKENDDVDENVEKEINHEDIKDRYEHFRRDFNEMRNKFQEFEEHI